MKETDPRHLYATTTFTFEKGHGGHPEPEDQFFVTQWTDNGWIRGQGVFDEKEPNFRSNYDSAASGWKVPIISHEIGQYSVYPNLREINKYTGTLEPLNFIAISDDLRQKGLLDRADEYTKASGRLAVKLYKEEIERALKTKDFNGYQLLGLQDFPGQSTALVGLVDAFWDSKGLCNEDYFRQFCAPVVPLALFDKATWSNTEIFDADIKIANYSNRDMTGQNIIWHLTTDRGREIANGKIENKNILKGILNNIGSISAPLSSIEDASRLTLSVSIGGSPYHNTWDIWCYAPKQITKDISVTRSVEEAIKLANMGKKVMLYPEKKENVKGLEGKFLPVFWSPVHFPKQAGTMGLLLKKGHPALSHFPTDINSDWQWWNIVKRSRVMDIDSINVTPLIESVDNFVNNRRLALMFEARLGKGSIIVSSIELCDEHVEVQHLLFSVTEYMNTPYFTPKNEITAEQLRTLFSNSEEKKTDAMSVYE